jgi:hypothetical protein
MTEQQTNLVKNEITKELGLPADHVMICCSHTHSGMEFDNNGFIKLGKVLSDVIRSASKKAEPVYIAYQRYDTGKQFCVNRRIRVSDQLGTFTMNYSRGNKVSVENSTVDARGQVEDFIRYGVNIYSPNYSTRGIKPGKAPSTLAQAVVDQLPEHLYLTGPVDPHLEVLAFRRADGTSVGTLVRFACHPVIFSGATSKQFSADYPGVLTREISKKTGSPTLFMNGPCGDVKPIFSAYGETETERFGSELAKMVTNSLDQMKATPLSTFQYIHRKVDFEVAPDMLKHSPADAGYDKLSGENFDPVVLKKKLDQSMRNWAIGYYGLKEDKLNLPFSLLGFNDIALLTLPGEIFNGHGLAVKKQFPNRPIIIGELTDTDSPGYVPTQASFQDGGYEVSCATIIPGSGEKMSEILTGMLKDFYRKR